MSDLRPNPWAAPIRCILSILLRRPLVALIDLDGEVTVRLARRNVLGQWWAERQGSGIRPVILNADGTISRGSYVKRWVLVRGEVA